MNSLRNLQTQYPDRTIEITQGDANDEIPNFCNKMKNLDRAVVFLDPYATQVSWSTVEKIALTQKIDCWILFPLMGSHADDAKTKRAGCRDSCPVRSHIWKT